MHKNKTINSILIIFIIILLIVLSFLLLKNKKENNHIIEINYSEYRELINRDEYSIIILTSPTCVHCNNYKPSVNHVCDKYDLTVYDLNLYNLSYEEYIELHDKYRATKDIYSQTDKPTILTPTTIITKNGEEIDSVSNNLGYIGLIDFLVENDIIKKWFEITFF